MNKELIYIADPMCSWCWGFAPVMARIATQINGRAQLRILPGGLRVGTQTALGAQGAAEIMHHWHEVAERSGQTFGLDQPLQADFVYDTGPACRAVSVMTRVLPSQALAYLHALHNAFYAQRRDLTSPQVLVACAEPFGFSSQAFADLLADKAASEAFEADWDEVRAYGIDGFPSVLVRDGEQLQRLTIGYQPFDAISPYLEKWLEQV